MRRGHDARSTEAASRRSPEELLDQYRRDIEALDRRVLHLVCERLELARQIGDLKRTCGVPLRNFEVEAQVHRRFEDASIDLGLDPGIGRDLARFLIGKAVEEQATLLDSAFRGNHLSTLIIGGKGGMGSWMAQFLATQGHRVAVYDIARGESPFDEAASLAAGIVGVDLIVVAVPMAVARVVLEEIAMLRPEAVVAEMCSLKGHLVPTMTRLQEGGLRLVSFHPMFGPDVRMLSGKTVVFCSNAARSDIDAVRLVFEDTSVELIEMDVAEHDRRMALVLGLTHLNNLVFARSMTYSGLTAAELAEVAGVTFTKQLATTREVSEENPDLYFQIQALNEITEETGGWLMRAVGEWIDVIVRGDRDGFAGMMEDCRAYLGNGETGVLADGQ